MKIETTVRSLAELSEVDRRLSGGAASEDRVGHALEGRRTALREAIPENYLAAYDSLGRSGRSPAVVPIVRGAHCGGCHMRVPPQLHAFVRRGQSVCSCPHCRRLLYSAPAIADPEGGNGSKSHPEKQSPAGKRAASARKPRPSRATGAGTKPRKA